MPQIPVYQQRTTAAGSLQLAPISKDAATAPLQGISALANSVRSGVQDVLTVREFERQQAEERGAVWANEHAMANRSRWVARLPELMDQSPEDGAGFTARALEEFDSSTADLIQQAPTTAARNWLKQNLAQQRLTLQQEGTSFERARGLKFKIAGSERALDSARIAAEARPQDFESIVSEQDVSLQAAGFTPELQSKLRETSYRTLGAAAVTGMIRRNPYQALKELTNEKSSLAPVRALDFDRRMQLRNHAEAEIRRREVEARSAQAEAKQALAERVRDATAAYRLGLDFDTPPTRAEFITALGADDGNKAFDSFAKEQQLGTAVATLATASNAEQEQLLAKFAPTGTAGVAEAAERYNVLRAQTERLRQQRHADPAAYVARYNPRVQAAFTAAQQSPEAARAYATATIAEQQRLGVTRPQILPKAEADAIAQSFYTQNGEQVAALIQTERQKWGQHWPKVFGELAAKKIPPAALAIGRGMEPGAATRLASMAATPMDELKKGVDVPAADIKDGVDAAMTDFMRTLDGVVGAENTYAGMRDAVERLTYSYLRQGKGTKESVKQAYNEVLGDHYAFREVNGRSFRVPTNANGVNYDVPGLEIGAQRALNTVPMDELKPPVPTSTGTPEAASADLKRAIQRRGYWVTSANGENGLALFLDGAPVLRTDGSVYEVSWDDLTRDIAATRGAIQQREDDRLFREAEGR